MIGKNSYLSISTNGMGLGNYIKYITWKTCRTLKFRRILFSDMFLSDIKNWLKFLQVIQVYYVRIALCRGVVIKFICICKNLKIKDMTR